MIKVVKFGGSSVANAKQFEKVKNIVNAEVARKFVVTSACGKEGKDDYKVTDLLYIAHTHVKYKVSVDDIFSLIEKKYYSIRDALKLKIDLEREFKKIKDDIAEDNDTDYLVSRGEYLTALMLAEYLDAKFVDAKDIFKFNYDQKINMEKTYEALQKVIDTDKKIVFPGFYGSMPDGKIKVMSRGGSDITGSILANLLNVNLYENWTDVSGILVCDPRIVENPKRIDSITYSELREMSYMGANVLHDEAVFPVKEKDIPINIKNTNEPDNPGTMILASFEDKEDEDIIHAITGITGKKDFSVVTCVKNHMSGAVGFMRKILSVFEKYGISVEFCPSGVDSVDVVVATSKLKKYYYEIVDELKEGLECDEVKVIDGIALVAVVGRRMRNKRSMSGKIFAELGANDINIRIISQGSDEICIIVGVDGENFEKAIRCIYNKFIG